MKTRRRRGLLLLSVALVCGGVAASEVRERERRIEERVGPEVAVLVAARDVPAGARIARGALGVRRVPARFVPPETLAPGASVVGARPAVAVPAGAYLTASVFAEAAGDRRDRGAGLARDERAVTLEVSLGGLGSLPAGTRVDVLVSTEAGRTTLALAGAELLALESANGGYDDAERPSSAPTALATLRVTLRQAIELTSADNFAREIRLLARPGP